MLESYISINIASKELSAWVIYKDAFLSESEVRALHLKCIIYLFFIIIIQMSRAHRGKQLDWSKPFKLITNKVDFQDLDTNEMVIDFTKKPEPPAATISKKEEIIVPKIEIVKRITEPKKFAKVEPNYLRLTQHLNLPKLDSYELNQVDHVFLQGQANKYKLNGKVVLTPEFLSRAFIELEKKAGKDPSLPKKKQWMVNFVERQYKELMAMPNFQQFVEVFYNYWKNRREELKFPLLRELWRPNHDQYSHLLAFKPRVQEKRNLRRNNRLAEDEIAQEMEEEFLLATKISERIKFREELKMKQIQLQLTNFHNECKQFFGFGTFFGQFDPQTRAKDKEKLKKLQSDVENVKRLQAQQDKQIELQTTNTTTTFDQKLSIAEFLSTVVNIAENFGLNYDKVFTDKAIQKQTSIAPSPIVVEEPVTTDEKNDFMAMKLYRQDNTIYRTFSQIDLEDEDNKEYFKAPKDIFEYRAKQMQYYYYGSDDEGQSKDLRKNISINFRKFQQSRPTIDI